MTKLTPAQLYKNYEVCQNVKMQMIEKNPQMELISKMSRTLFLSPETKREMVRRMYEAAVALGATPIKAYV